jgi:hypothetical protein
MYDSQGEKVCAIDGILNILIQTSLIFVISYIREMGLWLKHMNAAQNKIL